ncbi:MAG TPA: hypothetical protein VMH04_20260 [Candidatus Solibacter sp.]|nr:hypothetical protein [Candidatus Solibacter sp.]
MRPLPLALLLTTLCSLPLLGQSDVGNVFGGYTFERIAPGCGMDYKCGNLSAGPTTNINGWVAAMTVKSYKGLGFTGQFTGNYNGTAAFSSTTVTRYTFQFGPEYALHLRG